MNILQRALLSILLLAGLSACATGPTANNDQVQREREIYGDAAGPGSGVHIGIGAGSWGGRSGGGVGIGLGF